MSPAVQTALLTSDNIFFLRMTNETTLSTIERCALTSAVHQNPLRRVNFFTNSVSCELIRDTLNIDLHVIRYDPIDVYRGTPFEEWYVQREWDVAYRGVHLSDSTRLILLHRFGGAYFDTDIVSVRSLDGIGITIGLEDPWVINNAVMVFPHQHPFLAQCMHDFVYQFRKDFWGWNGPRLVTRIWMKYWASDANNNIRLAPIAEFYPLSWRSKDSKRFLISTSAKEATTILKHARAVHFWHSLMSDDLENFIAVNGGAFTTTLAGHVMGVACPSDPIFSSSTKEGVSLPPIIIDDKPWLNVYPIVEVSGGKVLPESNVQLFHGKWIQNTCGLFGGSVGVVEMAVAIKSPTRWTLSFWISTLVLDISSRLWTHHTPDTVPHCMPFCNFGIPAIPLHQGTLASKLAFANDNILVIAIEQGHVTIGNSSSEWSRTVSPISDGQWHHIGISVAPTKAGCLKLHFVLDGLLQIELIAEATFDAVVLGSTSSRGDLFLDKLGLFETTFTDTQLVRIRNAQLLTSRLQRCLPSMPWLQSLGQVSSFQGNARIITLIMSDTRLSSAADRMVVRNSWLTIAADSKRHVFCVGLGGDAALLENEAAQFGDILRVLVSDDYQYLSKKVHSCMSIVHALYADSYEFLIKTDQDVFLRIDVLEKELSLIYSEHISSSKEPLLHWQGFVYNSMPPWRDLSDKNADTMNPIIMFPPYTAGVGYILSAALVSELVAIPNPIFALNEDQALGLWMEQRMVIGGRRVVPLHDIRFQQWPVCYSEQVAIHISASHESKCQLATSNVRNGISLCEGMQLRPCCFCCDCDDSRKSWFSCDEHGAKLYTFVPLKSLIPSFAPFEYFDFGSPSNLFKQVAASIAPAQLECLWELGEWRALGIARLDRSMMGGGVRMACPRDITYIDRKTPSLCAASVKLRPQELTGMGFCVNSDAAGVIGKSTGHFETMLSFDSDSPDSDSPVVKNRCKQRSNHRFTPVKWLLFAAMIDTSGACTVNHLDLQHRQDLVTMKDYERAYDGPPYYGSFAAFCGVVIDVHHSDGTTSILRSAFARNASAHLHYQVLRVFKTADIVDIVINIIQPSFLMSASFISISNIKLLRLNIADEPDDPRIKDARIAALQLATIDPRHRGAVNEAATALPGNTRSRRSLDFQFEHGLCLPLTSIVYWPQQIAIIMVIAIVTLFVREGRALARSLSASRNSRRCKASIPVHRSL